VDLRDYEAAPAAVTPCKCVGLPAISFTTLVGGAGAFRFADHVDDANWLPETSEDTKLTFKEKLVPLRIIGIAADGRSELCGTVIFKNILCVTSVMVARYWQLELANGDVLLEDLSIALGQKIDLLVRH
jgi:hypothetical protein